MGGAGGLAGRALSGLERCIGKEKFEDELLKTPSLRVSQVRYFPPSRQVDVPKSSK